MEITWYGTASVLLEISGTSLLFDPFLKYLPVGYEPDELHEQREKAFETAANILITHGHLDHYDDAFPSVSELTPVDDFCRRMSAKVPTEKMMEGKRIKV